MISTHTKQSVSAVDLAKRGKLIHVSGDNYRYDVPENENVGVGSVSSFWTAEPGEQVINHGVIGQASHIYAGGQLVHQNTD